MKQQFLKITYFNFLLFYYTAFSTISIINDANCRNKQSYTHRKQNCTCSTILFIYQQIYYATYFGSYKLYNKLKKLEIIHAAYALLDALISYVNVFQTRKTISKVVQVFFIRDHIQLRSVASNKF